MKKIILVLILFLLTLGSCKNDNSNNNKNDVYFKVTLEDLAELDLNYEDLSIKDGESINLTLPNTIVKSSSSFQRVDEIITINYNSTKYSFISWSDSDNNKYSGKVTVSKDLDLHLEYSTTNTNKTFVLHIYDGELEDEILNKFNYNNLNNLSPYKDNYTFEGWYGDESFTSKIEDLSSTSDSQDLYAKYLIDVNYLNIQINILNNEITFDNIDLIDNLYSEFTKLPTSSRRNVPNASDLVSLHNRIGSYKTARYIYNSINVYNEKLSSNSIYGGDLKNINNLIKKYNELDENDAKKLITNYNLVENCKTKAQQQYAIALENTVDYRKKLASIQIGSEYSNQNRIKELETMFDQLDPNSSSIIDNGKLSILQNNLQEVLNQEQIFVLDNGLNQTIYTSREKLFNALFTDFYYFMELECNQPMASVGVPSLEEFLSIASNYSYGRGEMRGIGDLAGDYFLKKDINGIIENQPENKFLGFCYKNNMYTDFLPFFLRFFAYWRIDERYASLNNYGADTFAEAWAPTVDLAKFFYYTIDTCYVQTDRMRDCYNRTANVVYNFYNRLTNQIRLRGYIFEGWYDNPECTGEAITDSTNAKVLYAKWSADVETNELDAANLVVVYIYNLTTSRAVVNTTTISYARNMYDNLPTNAKQYVTNYNELLELEQNNAN